MAQNAWPYGYGYIIDKAVMHHAKVGGQRKTGDLLGAPYLFQIN